MFDYSDIRIGKNSRAVTTSIVNGTAVLKDKDGKDEWVEKITLKDKVVVEHKIIKNGSYTYWIKYGQFEKAKSGRAFSYIKRYRNGSAKSYHGLTMRRDVKLFGQEGTCYTFYNRGRWTWQKFIYSNGRVAYSTKDKVFKGQVFTGVHPNGRKMFEINCPNGFIGRGKSGVPFIMAKAQRYENREYDYSTDGNCVYTIYDSRGRIRYKGEYVNRQKSGEWVEDYTLYFMYKGLKVPKDLFNAKAEDIDPKSIMKETNSQVRAMLIAKIGTERLLKGLKGKLVHKDESNGNELYDIPCTRYKDNEWGDPVDKAERILKVICPSTKSAYFLRVPATEDFNTCEKARQGTFTGFDPDKVVEFAIET